ncbi:MAG: hypothetical protein ABR879_06990 [Methanomassiliicoccales archaeon]|jgi:hypothetical protein
MKKMPLLILALIGTICLLATLACLVTLANEAGDTTTRQVYFPETVVPQVHYVEVNGVNH